MRTTRITLAACLFMILVVGLIGVALAKRLYWTYPHEAGTFSYYNNRDQYFTVFPRDSNAIVFLGNSLTQNFELAELLKDSRVRNRGINGDIITGLIGRLGPIIKSKPEKVFIEIGINDLGKGMSRQQVIADYKRLIDTLRRSLPVTKLYVQSILPVEDISSNGLMPGHCSSKINADIVAINIYLQQYAEHKGAEYIDLHSHFKASKYRIPDGVHLTGEAYLLWAKLLKPYL